jgi:hypothetical protein
MRRISAKIVPRHFTNDQKQRRVNLCVELREEVTEDPTFISRIITGEESWIYGYDPETKQQSSQCLTFKGNRKRYSTALREMTSTVLLKLGKNDGIAVYVLKETILKEMAAKISKLSLHFFFDLVRELSDTPRMLFLHFVLPSFSLKPEIRLNDT